MSVIDRYIVRTFLSGYVILMLVGIGLYVVSGLLLNIDEFTEDTGLPPLEVLARIADFYGSNIPLYYSQLAGPMMAVAAAFTVGMMLKNNELTALIAAGVPLQRLGVPLFLAASVLIGFWVINREVIMPPLASKMARKHDDVLGARTQGVLARDAENVIVTSLRLFPIEGRMERVFLIEPDARGNPHDLIEADAAVYDAERKLWVLERGFRYVIDESGRDGPGLRIRNSPVDEYPLRFTPQDLALRRESQWADYLSSGQLNQLLRSRNLPNWPSVNMSRHVRLTQPLLHAILLALTLPFFLTRDQGNVLAAGGWAVLVAGAFYLLTFISQNVVNDVAYQALVAWLPILVFGPAAVLQVANIRT